MCCWAQSMSEKDFGVERAAQVLRGAECVIALTPYMSEATGSNATILLPIGTFAETSGTYVNLEGRWQSFAGAVKPVGECRPGGRCCAFSAICLILRVSTTRAPKGCATS